MHICSSQLELEEMTSQSRREIILTHHRRPYINPKYHQNHHLKQPIGEIGSVHLIMTMHGVHTTLSKQVMKRTITTIIIAQ